MVFPLTTWSQRWRECDRLLRHFAYKVLLKRVITERCQNAILDAASRDTLALPDATGVDLTTSPRDALTCAPDERVNDDAHRKSCANSFRTW
jgi:hypothetical protein